MAMHALILNSSIQITIGTFCRSKCLFQKILQRNDSYALRTQTWNANYTVEELLCFPAFSGGLRQQSIYFVSTTQQITQ